MHTEISVRLDLSVDPSLIRLVRHTVSGVASALDMSTDDVECCRAAADEMCSTLMQIGDTTCTVSVQIGVSEGSLVVAGQVERDVERGLDAGRAELARMIVEATTDEHEFVTDPPIASFRFAKRGTQRAGVVDGER